MKGLPLWLWFCFEEIEKLTKTRMLPSARYVSSTRGKMMAKPTATPTCEQKLLVFPQHGSHCERLWYLNLNKKFIVNRHGVQVSHSFTVFQSISLVTSQNSRENHFNNVYMMYCSMRWHARCCITDGLMIMGLSSPPGSLADKTTNIMVTIGWWWWWWWWWGSMDWAHPQEVLKTKEQSSALVSVVREADYRHQQSLMIRLYLYLYLMSYFVYIFVFVFLSIAMYFVSLV